MSVCVNARGDSRESESERGSEVSHRVNGSSERAAESVD